MLSQTRKGGRSSSKSDLWSFFRDHWGTRGGVKGGIEQALKKGRFFSDRVWPDLSV